METRVGSNKRKTQNFESHWNTLYKVRQEPENWQNGYRRRVYHVCYGGCNTFDCYFAAFIYIKSEYNFKMFIKKGRLKLTDYKTIGKRFAERRRKLGMKQHELAELTELSDKYISNIERAYSIPSIEVILRLCDALQTTPDHILLGTSNADSDYIRIIEKKLQLLGEEQLKLINGIIDLLAES